MRATATKPRAPADPLTLNVKLPHLPRHRKPASIRVIGKATTLLGQTHRIVAAVHL